MSNAYKYIKENIRKNLQKTLISWRTQDAALHIEKPTVISTARRLGYKDKKGFVIVRVRLLRGGHRRSRPVKGRTHMKNLSVRMNLKMNYQWIAEQRAARAYPNLEVLNSYKIAKDGKNYFFEVIMVDPSRPEIKADKDINWICDPINHDRAFRGLTSAAKKSRGLSTKSREMKVRPSQRAHNRQGK